MRADAYMGTTTSACPDCRRLIPARVHLRDGAVWLHKLCPDHGAQEVRVSSDAEHYLDASRYHRAGSIPLRFGTGFRGCPDSCGLCPEHEQHVCMPILEITDHCDLACPICLVDCRPQRHLTVREVEGILDTLAASEGQIDVLNLSGGEPLLHPRFAEIVEMCARRPEILRVSVSTNGLVLGRRPDLLRLLKDLDVVVSLQFDGRDDSAYRALRGRPLLEEKLRLLDLLGEGDIATSLTATVAAGVNLEMLPGIIDLAFQRDHVLSVTIQPLAHVGRGAAMPRPEGAATVPDILRALDGARGGTIAASDFSPLPCSHPACFSLAYYLRTGAETFVPIKGLFGDLDRYLDILANRALFGTDPEGFEAVKAAVYDLWSGPAALAPDSTKALRAVRRIIEEAEGCCFRPRQVVRAAERSLKSIFIHAFMDPHTFDLARARKCCNVYPMPDGRLVPACIHNCLRRS